MTVDLLVVEIGSTTTVVNVFDALHTTPRFLGQGMAPTSVDQGDVTIGVRAAWAAAEAKLGPLRARQTLATSSAAGGLRMSVHGLVYDMTVRAAREAALGSGAVIVNVTGGRLTPDDVDEVLAARPKMILVAGGVDHGERETALANVKALAQRLGAIPLVYAGNVDNVRAVRRIASEHNVALSVAENVYPTIDRLNVEPTRAVIQREFERVIAQAPGMERLRSLVDGPIMPTPGAVMRAAELAHDRFGDVLVLDVGGATTDVHSVTAGSESIQALQTSPEPFAKRTVEGDLGVYVNRRHVLEAVGTTRLAREWPGAEDDVEGLAPVPQSAVDWTTARRLTAYCVELATARHAGRLVDRYVGGGRVTTVEGRDLTAVTTIVATGGALTALDPNGALLSTIRRPPGSKRLYPPLDAAIYVDREYIMASLGVMALRYEAAAGTLLQTTLNKVR